MSDQEKLAEAMLKLAAAISELSAKMPQPGLGGALTVYHQNIPPHMPQPSWQRMDYQSPYYGGGGNL